MILALAILASRTLSSLLQRRIAKRAYLDPGLRYTMGRLTQYLIIAVGVLLSLKAAFNLDLTSIAVLFTALSVDFDVTVPSAAALQLKTNTGSIDVSGVSGQMALSSNTGSLQVSAAPQRVDIRNIFPECCRQINLVVLLVDENLADLLSH